MGSKPYAQTAANAPRNGLECTQNRQEMETSNAAAHILNYHASTRNVGAQPGTVMHFGDHGHTPINTTRPNSASANSPPLKEGPSFSSRASPPSPNDERCSIRTGLESVSNETRLELHDEWRQQAEKVQIVEPQLKRFENVSRVSEQRIKDIRASSGGEWVGTSGETIPHTVIKLKLKKRARGKHDQFSWL